MKQLRLALLGLALGIAGSGNVHAVWVPLSDLISGTSTISAGNLTFSDWDASFLATDADPILSQILVEVTTPSPTEVTLTFDAQGQMAVIDGEQLDLSIQFGVSSMDTRMITAVALGLTDSTGPVADIYEFVYPDEATLLRDGIPPPLVGNNAIARPLKVSNDGLNSISSDIVGFPGRTSLFIYKNSYLFGDGDGASIRTFTQTFTTTQAPEPSTVLLLGLGLAGFVVTV